jgi:hypothetical protein
MNYFQSMTNPKTFAIKKYMFEILQQKYPDHEQIVERMANTILTERDFNEFNQLIAAIYETGYLKAVNDYREQLSKLGLKVAVVPEKKAT